MRQDTLGTMLDELMQGSASIRVRVEAQETGDVNAPDWVAVCHHVPMMIVDLGAEQRLEQSASYEATVTHEAYCGDRDCLQIGYRLVETHRRYEGTMMGWVAVATPRTWEIIAKQRLSGVPEPADQVRLSLSQTSAVT